MPEKYTFYKSITSANISHECLEQTSPFGFDEQMLSPMEKLIKRDERSFHNKNIQWI